MLERVGLPRNTAYRWMRVAKTGLDADYIATEYGSVTELLKDRDATSGRLADMLLKLEACQGHEELIAELQAELAAAIGRTSRFSEPCGQSGHLLHNQIRVSVIVVEKTPRMAGRRQICPKRLQAFKLQHPAISW